MIKHAKIGLFLAAALLIFFDQALLAQQTYQMKPVVMQTRWAKQVDPKRPLTAYPRPQMERDNWTNLNGLWDYTITKKDAPIPQSYTGKILVPYPIESALSGVKKGLLPDENLWYKLSLRKPKLSDSKRVLLHFGAVDWQAAIFINGTQVGEHTGGYTAFSMDITEALKNGDNELVVKVYDPSDRGIGPHGKQMLSPGNIYYTPSSGIWQTVWMETVSSDYIESLTITPDIDRSLVTIIVNAAKNSLVHLTAAGKTVSGKANTIISLPIKNAQLWSPDNPYLYDLKVTMGKDVVKSYFGMRKINIGKDEKGIDRIFLNNKYTYNLGVLDQGFWPDGLYTAPTDEALGFDIKAIKAMGFNTIRKHIKVEPARWYYHADKLGMLVWQDFVNPNQNLPEGARKAFEEQIKETMDQLRNYPSITTWVLFNERWGAFDQKRLTEWVKEHDSSRLVNGHSGELLYVNKQLRAPSDEPFISSDMVDYHSYPDPMEVKPMKGKVSVLGEFGGVGVSVPEHQWDDLQGWGYVQVSPNDFKGNYQSMINRLQRLEKEGLSASIYTQPFDVEGEENGMLTYDREIIKIPVQELRKMHGVLIKQSRGFALDPTFSIAKDVDVSDNDSRFPEFMKQYQASKTDSAFLRRLVLMALRKKDQQAATEVGKKYINSIKCIYCNDNLLFIDKITRTSKDGGFELFKTHAAYVDSVLGNGFAERKIKKIIRSEDIDPFLTGNTQPDWDGIQQRVSKKYDSLGTTYILGERMAYYSKVKDWENYARTFMQYFERARENPEYNINSMSWMIFVNVNDVKVLKFATNLMEYAMQRWYIAESNFYAYDTYANLLYKTGNTSEAIKWQEQAVKLSTNNEKVVKNFEKMKQGKNTWPDK